MTWEDQIERAAALVDGAQRVAVLTGAGISTDSGIPDYRGPNGVWTKNPQAEKQATLEHYLGDPEVRKRAWRSRLDNPMLKNAEPNVGHLALVELERRGKLHTLVTQNVDGLHRKAGTDPAKLVEDRVRPRPDRQRVSRDGQCGRCTVHGSPPEQ